MTGVKLAVSERIETLRQYVGKSVVEMQTEVDRVIELVREGKATEVEERRASVLARVIIDRIGKGEYRG